jgi:cellulose biosynthesis protein BcsQ
VYHDVAMRGLNLLASHWSLLTDMGNLLTMNTRVDVLPAIIDPLRDATDLVIIDTNPKYGDALLTNSLCASTDVICPVVPAADPVEGVPRFMQLVDAVRTTHNPRLVCRGIVVNGRDQRVAEQPEYLEILYRMGYPMLHTQIPLRQEINKARSQLVPVCVLNPTGLPAMSYEWLAHELIELMSHSEVTA